LQSRLDAICSHHQSAGEEDKMAEEFRRRVYYAEAFWRAHHEAWKRSELNQREYCAAEGISLKAFGNWRAKFKAEPQPLERKLLYRRGGLSHTLSRGPSHPLGHVPYLSSWLRDLARRGEEAVSWLMTKDGKTKAGRNKAEPPGHASPKTFCAAIILEAWRLIHGIELAPRNPRTAAAAEGSGSLPRVHQRRAGEGGARKDCRQRIKKLGRTAVFEHPSLGN
jgi:hypothetical protein